ncbi:cleavage and polyadenylation specificity factor subunit 1, partial [Tanacetum coccineum]
MSINALTAFQTSKNSVITACTLYHDRGTEPWLRKASTDAWLLTGVSEAIEGPDGTPHDQGDIYCVICYETGTLEIYDVPNFSCVFSVDSFASGRIFIGDNLFQESSDDSQKAFQNNRKDNSQNLKVVELAMHRWHGENSRPFLFGILADGTILCYHAYLYEGSENASKGEVVNGQSSSNPSASRLKNLRFSRVSLDTYTREEISTENSIPRITMFKNVGGYPGFFLSGSRPTWFMKLRERLRIHPQLCDGPIIAFTVLHNMYCNHGFIYVTAQGSLKICQLPSSLSYDNYWPVQKIPLKATPHQVTYFAEKNLYPLIVSVPVSKPLNQVLSTLVDQESAHQIEHDNLNSDGVYTVEEFEVRIMEPESSGGPWKTKGTIRMQTSENALTVRVVTLSNTTTRESETLLAVGTAYVQGEDVAARGRVLLFSVENGTEGSQATVTEVYSKEMKGAISAVASFQGYLLVASGPKIILHKWTGSDLSGVAFFDAPPL